MRNAFASEITHQAELRKDIVLLSGDIGNRMFETYKEKAPGRFINCGIAEGNMMSLAAGLGLCDFRPIIYTITPFTTTRCLEQIRVGVAYHNSPVIIIGTGSGLSYSELGPTHHSLEDMAIMRSIPNKNKLAPCDSNELIAQLREALTIDKPTYMRIGKKGEKILTSNTNSLGIGKPNFIRNGEKIAIIGVGPILSEAVTACEFLKGKGINPAVISFGGIRPVNEDFLLDIIQRGFTTWVTIEEHGLIGGLRSTLIEWIWNKNFKKEVNLLSIGVENEFIHRIGDQDYTRKLLGLNSDSIIELIAKIK